MPEIASTIDAWSCQRPRRTPDSTPIPTPTVTDHSIAKTVSSRVGMKRSPISSTTGWCVLIERPRRNCTVSPR